jgi:hypothetical protein
MGDLDNLITGDKYLNNRRGQYAQKEMVCVHHGTMKLI